MSRSRIQAGVAVVAGGLLLGVGLLRCAGDPGSSGEAGGTRDGAKRTVFDEGSRTTDETVPVVPRVGLVAAGEVDPATMVTCAVEPPLDDVSVDLIDDAIPDIPEVAKILEGILQIPAPRAEGSGILKVPGHVPVPIRWADGRCLAEPVRLVVGSAAVVGRVVGADGEPEGAVKVWGCGETARTDRDGSFYLEGVPGRTCSLQATREDGVFTATSEPVQVTPVANEDQVVELELPEARTGGVGVRVRQTADGVEVVGTLEGSSAADAGVASGDLLLAVDGEDTELLALDELDALLTGEVGSAVVLRIQGEEGSVREVELERREH